MCIHVCMHSHMHVGELHRGTGCAGLVCDYESRVHEQIDSCVWGAVSQGVCVCVYMHVNLYVDGGLRMSTVTSCVSRGRDVVCGMPVDVCAGM